MSNQMKFVHTSKKKVAGVPAKRHHGKQNVWLRTIVASFLGGIGFCLLWLILFALLLSRTAVPLTLVRPFACAAAAMGTAVSGYLLAKGINRQYLLCGLACGFFYAICQLLATFLANGFLLPQSSDLMLSVALLLGGILGASLAALREGH